MGTQKWECTSDTWTKMDIKNSALSEEAREKNKGNIKDSIYMFKNTKNYLQ